MRPRTEQTILGFVGGIALMAFLLLVGWEHEHATMVAYFVMFTTWGNREAA